MLFRSEDENCGSETRELAISHIATGPIQSRFEILNVKLRDLRILCSVQLQLLQLFLRLHTIMFKPVSPVSVSPPESSSHHSYYATYSQTHSRSCTYSATSLIPNPTADTFQEYSLDAGLATPAG